MIRYFLNSFAQGGYDDDPVNCEVRYEDDADPAITGTYPSQPLDGAKLGPKWGNAELCAALSAQLGKNVEQMKLAKPKPVPVVQPAVAVPGDPIIP